MIDWKNYSEIRYPFDHEQFYVPFEVKAAQFISCASHVLEIGSGLGRFVDLALRRSARSVTIVEAREDSLPRLLNWSSVARAAVKDRRLHFIHGEWPQAYDQLPRPNYNVIFSYSSLHYLDRALRHEAFMKVRDVLDPSGIFALALRSIDNGWLEYGIAKQIEKDRWLCGDGIVRTFFTAQGLRNELIEVGFEKDRMQIEANILEGYEGKEIISVWLECLIRA